jgi:GGDEF domain-containing protein
MRYKDYEGYTKPFVICHNTGFGTPEANYIERDVVGEADTYEEAREIADKFKRANNDPEDVESGWCYNTYHINVNTLSPDSKPLFDEFNKEADAALQRVKDNPNGYTTHKFNGITFHMQKMPEFDDPDSPKIEF